MLVRHSLDNYEFELTENDVVEQQADQHARISIKGSNNFGKQITCDLFMTYELLVRLKKQIDDALTAHASANGAASV